MGLFDKLRGSGGAGSAPKMPARFKAKIERKTATQTLVFDVDVKGYFVGKAGKPDFIAQDVTVVGVPSMNMTSFFPKEIEEIRRYAIRVEYPRLIGKKDPQS
ncbi:MAG TPA: hypothetical protein VL126_15675, partial [Bacteroidota bacterium]|nr:hypothetical protein [Bacteroidota bacterium]